MDFSDRRVVVAGGSRGIGRAIALGFARAGAAVSICARGVPGLEAARAEIAESLAAAWQRAAPPFAPLHRIPGITWSPAEAVVAHVPAR